MKKLSPRQWDEKYPGKIEKFDINFNSLSSRSLFFITLYSIKELQNRGVDFLKKLNSSILPMDKL